MKVLYTKLLSTMLFIFTASIPLAAQYQSTATEINPKETTHMHNDKLAPCIIVNLDPEPKTLKKAWQDYLKKNHGFKLKGIGFLRNADLLTAEEVLLNPISSSPIDLYTHIVEDLNGSEMKVFASLGYDRYIDPVDNPKQFSAMKQILENFLTVYLPEYYQGRVNDAKKRVEELLKESSQLEGDISDNTREIEQLEEEINSLKEKRKENEEALSIAQEKLEMRKKKLDRVRRQLQ